AERLAGRSLDLLVANAGVLNSYGALDDPAHDAAAWRSVLMTNVFGPYLTVRVLRHLLKGANPGKIAVISSNMGSTARASNRGAAYPYCASKAAATNLALNLSAELAAEGVAVGAYHPGWVRTEMGGAAADISTQQSAEGLLKRFDALSLTTTGVFEDYQGRRLPF
ncbi:MAG: SDR family NAD(P)-dependent oxidoreductase, partial [Rhodobacteraceae bacterium]|nr:SDR family NAD(P)-dependent oxidoreductase [Paracoccaceae bacterium]